MYRAAALLATRSGLSLSDGPGLARLLGDHSISVDSSGAFLDGSDVSLEIRAPDIGDAASVVSTNTGVRLAMVILQRRFASSRSVVAEGRDMGTVVFPEASLKVYVIADLATRTVRRLRELRKAGVEASFGQTASALIMRDRRDRERVDSPLRPSPSSLWLDTTLMTIGEQVRRVVTAFRMHEMEEGRRNG